MKLKKKFKNFENSVVYRVLKQWKCIVPLVKNIPLTKIQALEKLNKTGSCLYQIVLFVARKNQFL